ncbi:MAG: PA4780 family RIO1-like protein kinase [Myxococcota bacterium]|nr:PA4780 family RIO1-like protein kinase [Myxococcota bacterium]
MSVPGPLAELLDLGVIDEVIRPLQAGKEAQVYLVISKGETRVAKVYKESNQRSFKHRSDYTEGRRVRNSRQQRAMNKNSRYGRKENEAAWRSAEVDCLYRLFAAGVRVPTPYDFIDGVLIMELIENGEGSPAPRLADLNLSPGEAESLLKMLVQEVVRMLCAGIVHGDLSDFNILIDPKGPVIIDLPQAVDPAQNQQARRLLIRDVKNITMFMARFAPRLRRLKYGPEMWALYERGELTPETILTGQFKRSEQQTDTRSVLDEIQDAAREAAALQQARGGPSKYAARKAQKLRDQAAAEAAERARQEKREEQARARKEQKAAQGTNPAANGDQPRKRRRRRRRRRGPRKPSQD